MPSVSLKLTHGPNKRTQVNDVVTYIRTKTTQGRGYFATRPELVVRGINVSVEELHRMCDDGILINTDGNYSLGPEAQEYMAPKRRL